jgi:hypothetical protein
MDHPILIDGVSQTLYDNATRVPADAEATLLHGTEPITDLVYRGFPLFLPQSITSLVSATSCITGIDVCGSVEDILANPVPVKSWINRLELELQRRMDLKSSPASLRHPGTTNLFLPLWAVTYWAALASAMDQQIQWVESMEWLRERMVEGLSIAAANIVLQRMPWGMTISAIPESSTSVVLLSHLLSDKWLRERHLDIFAVYLTSRTRGHAAEWWFGAVYLSVLIKGFEVPKGTAGRSKGSLGDFEEMITAGGYKFLMFPANLSRKHWILFHVDVERKEFRFGVPSHLFCAWGAYLMPCNGVQEIPINSNIKT